LALRRGDDKARAWLSSYLVGNADSKAGRLSKIESAERQLVRDDEMEKLWEYNPFCCRLFFIFQLKPDSLSR
jgi:hypothetical protein